ncbi:dehydroquinate synthase [Catenovulum agarivorans DS-2]|uniref:3-dehydroquinate synthase n=1 Tax=Catenovulum agarivorans DS-2 TaxID=1328313 RepID=W7QVB6_9ALTE|nr:3-dehydroquinate synthase [Catenovulum agarivorans]EWH09240.1 dehydroquinate synthase [Catenovulum agarivorans DS-2]
MSTSEIQVELGDRSYPIVIGQGLVGDKQTFNRLIKGKKVVVVTNETIAPLYLSKLLGALESFEVLSYQLPDGEQYKSLESFEKVNSFLLEHNCGRDITLVALGGGVVGDLVGFVAACYQRGVDFIQVPTTLLSQVDSSVGGKTAVNHPLGKNMIGAFKQPEAVVIDTDTLLTLPVREFAAGMAEVLKYGIIFDRSFWQSLIDNKPQISALEQTELVRIIRRCCEIKAEIVAADETEKGARALLNLGHTFGHAIEAEMGYGVWLHGEAVGTGMVLAAKLAEMRGYISPEDYAEIKQTIAAYQLPVEKPESMNCADFVKHMKRDKKVQNNVMRFIVPTQIGQCQIMDDVTELELENILK